MDGQHGRATAGMTALWLGDWMVDQGLRVKDVAALLEVSPVQVCRWMARPGRKIHRQPRATTLHKITEKTGGLVTAAGMAAGPRDGWDAWERSRNRGGRPRGRRAEAARGADG